MNTNKTIEQRRNDALKMLGTSWVLHSAYQPEHNPAHRYRSGSYHLAKFIAGRTVRGAK